MDNRELWPIENVIRGQFYLSQILKGRNPLDQAALDLEKEAKESLERLLEEDGSGRELDYRHNLPLLYDYIVHWECRLVTPRIRNNEIILRTS